jgi:hypothetical protein
MSGPPTGSGARLFSSQGAAAAHGVMDAAGSQLAYRRRGAVQRVDGCGLRALRLGKADAHVLLRAFSALHDVGSVPDRVSLERFLRRRPHTPNVFCRVTHAASGSVQWMQLQAPPTRGGVLCCTPCLLAGRGCSHVVQAGKRAPRRGQRPRQGVGVDAPAAVAVDVVVTTRNALLAMPCTPPWQRAVPGLLAAAPHLKASGAPQWRKAWRMQLRHGPVAGSGALCNTAWHGCSPRALRPARAGCSQSFQAGQRTPRRGKRPRQGVVGEAPAAAATHACAACQPQSLASIS